MLSYMENILLFNINKNRKLIWLTGKPSIRSFVDDSMPPLTDSRLIEKRRLFWEAEHQREAEVKLDQLSDEEKRIHECHKTAVLKGHFTYNDPVTGSKEFTRLRHYLRGTCCGNACRHCIYDHVKVPAAKLRSKRFNTSFWVYDSPATPGPEDDEDMMIQLRKPKLRSQ